MSKEKNRGIEWLWLINNEIKSAREIVNQVDLIILGKESKRERDQGNL